MSTLLICMVAAFGASVGMPAKSPATASTAVSARPSSVDGSAASASASALPSGGPDFDATMLSWSTPSPVSVAERLEFPVAMTHLSSRFGVRRDPLHGELRPHLGIDIPDPLGTPVHAASSGVVTFAGWSRGYGNLVRIDHGDGNETRYAHLSAIAVSPGFVDQGAIIGNVGSTGRSTGAHLHFEVRHNGLAMDPIAQDGLPLWHESRQPSVPPHSHWSGFGPTDTDLPQSRLR